MFLTTYFINATSLWSHFVSDVLTAVWVLKTNIFPVLSFLFLFCSSLSTCMGVKQSYLLKIACLNCQCTRLDLGSKCIILIGKVTVANVSCNPTLVLRWLVVLVVLFQDCYVIVQKTTVIILERLERVLGMEVSFWSLSLVLHSFLILSYAGLFLTNMLTVSVLFLLLATRCSFRG